MKGLVVRIAGTDKEKILEAIEDLVKEIKLGTQNCRTPDNGQGWEVDYDLIDLKANNSDDAIDEMVELERKL